MLTFSTLFARLLRCQLLFGRGLERGFGDLEGVFFTNCPDIGGGDVGVDLR